MDYYVVKYSGPFGFIKPWTAVRDGETYSQQFLTPSMIEGMEKKLFPDLLKRQGLQGYIIGHRLNYTGISRQQEQTWSKAWIEKKVRSVIKHQKITTKDSKESKESKISSTTCRPSMAILIRGVLIEPNLYLAFSNRQHAERAFEQHICLGRNEDLLLPDELTVASESEWQSELYPGFQLLINTNTGLQFKVGHNRFDNASAMYGEVRSFGDPIRKRAEYL